MNILSLLMVLNLLVYQVCCILDPITFSVVAAGVGMYLLNIQTVNKSAGKVMKYIGQKIGYVEGCEDHWIPGNMYGLEMDLRGNVFGQPLALDIVLNAMTAHLDPNNRPERGLLLSFHGSPGTGKNFVSEKIIKNMFKKGHKSDFTLFFRSSIDFPSHNKIEHYQKIIVDKIKDKVHECRRSVVVFDEVEKMPPGMLDVLSYFFMNGVHGEYDFRRLIVILLSNSGNRVINSLALQSHKTGVDRGNINVRDMTRNLSVEVYNTEGGLQRTGLINKLGVSHYVPFLPLTQEHITECINAILTRLEQPYSYELAQAVIEDITFVPEDLPLFAYGGCKGLESKIPYLIEGERRRQRKKF